MSEIPYASGLTIDGVRVPLPVEAADGTRQERAAVIEGFVTDYADKGVELALVRADARLDGADPDLAETTFEAAQAAATADAAADAVAAKSPILSTPNASQLGGLG